MIFQSKLNEVYKARLFRRCDDTGLAYYFSYKDFEGLAAEKYAFRSSRGHALQGYFYHYENYDKSRIVVFEHGFFGGHRSYMKEIELLCRAGYLVFAYDHTGCMESGGENAGGLSQSLCDLDDCLKALKSDKEVNTDDISVIGHSWGAYSTMNISALHPDVRRVVVLSGYVSVKRMIAQNFPGALAPFRRGIMQIERESNPAYVDFDGIESLANSNVRALLIYSADDRMISRKLHYDVLARKFAGNDRVEMLLLDNKGHNPNYTSTAIALLAAYSAKKAELPPEATAEEKAKFRQLFDWDKMTEQDDEVWHKIFDFLAK